MELKKIACDTCGGELEVNEKKTVAKCLVCGNSYFIKNNESCGTNLTALLIRARLFIEELDFVEATNTCDRISALNDEIVELWLYLLLIEAKVSSLEELYDTDKDYTESLNYTNALFYAHSSENNPYIEDLEALKRKRTDKLRRFIDNNPDLAKNALAESQVHSFLDNSLLSRKSKNDIYIHDKTEYLYCENQGFYNINILKFELNNLLGLFGDFVLEGMNIKKCHRNKSVIEIPFGIQEIASYAFCGSTASAIIVPESVKCIEKYAFVECKNLSSFTIPNSVSVIAKNAFTNCTNLSSVVIPSGITSIESYAFAGCTALKSIKLPEGCANIGEYAFSQCRSISSLKIPDSVAFVGRGAFSDKLGRDTNQTLLVNKEQSFKWYEAWNEHCKAKIVYR